MIAADQARLRLLVVDDGAGPGRGRVVYRGHDGYRPTAAQIAHVRAAYPTSLGPASRVRAERCDVDHFKERPEGRTVETYKARAMEKLGLTTRVDVVRYAADRGWLTGG